MRIGILSGFVFFVVSRAVLADGLAYRLPPDGTWVKYKITVQKYQEWDTRYEEKKGWVLEKKPDPTAEELAKETDSLLVRSVGRQAVGGEPCRWIEIVQNADEEGKAPPELRVIVLKLLISEKAFEAGRDPFEHVRKMYMSDRRDGEHLVSEVKDADRRRYESERFRAYFPVSPKGTKRGKEVERKTLAGLFKGNETAFIYGYEGKLSAGKSGWNISKGRYVVVVSDCAPFGIVAVTARDVLSIEEYGAEGFAELGAEALHGGRLIQSWTMEVVATGTGAKSGLPNNK